MPKTKAAPIATANPRDFDHDALAKTYERWARDLEKLAAEGVEHADERALGWWLFAEFVRYDGMAPNARRVYAAEVLAA